MSDAPLVPYQGRNDIAYVKRELATKRDELVRKGNLFRVTDMYVGRYGVLGYVEMSLKNDVPDLSGILEIPGRLVESMERTPGMMGYISEVIFGQSQYFTKVYGKEDKSHPSLEGIALFDSEYYWWPHPGFDNVKLARVNEKIKELEEMVIELITKFDKSLDRLVPEDKRPTYSSLLMLGPG